MKIRPIFFWVHLVSGVVAGLVVVMMSVTGVLLTYEHQMIHSAEMSMYSADSTDGKTVPLQQAMETAGTAVGRSPAGLTVYPSEEAPYLVQFGRRGPNAYVDAYSGEYLGDGDTDLRNTFGLITRWHRWFALDGESRETGAMITGASNLLFLFLVLSGMYLWLPKTVNWLILKSKMWFNPRVNNAKARDYNWHHVFGFWSAIPLVVVVATAVVFSYSWANDLLFNLTSEVSPQTVRSVPSSGMSGGMGGIARGGEQVAPVIRIRSEPGAMALSLDELLSKVKEQEDDWESITVNPIEGTNSPASIVIHYAAGNQPQKDETWLMNPYTGEVAAKSGWEDRPRAERARTAVRRLHTGEYLGIVGQTIAGLVSGFSVLMVWTGLAMAWRRLISPLLKKRALAAPQN